MDGPGGSRNPLGVTLFGPGTAAEDIQAQACARVRSVADGIVKPPIKANTMAHNGIRIWNGSRELRRTQTLSEAKLAAARVARASPL